MDPELEEFLESISEPKYLRDYPYEIQLKILELKEMGLVDFDHGVVSGKRIVLVKKRKPQ